MGPAGERVACHPTEGANSHTRSGPVLHTTIAVWRDVTDVTHRRSKAAGTTSRLNLSGTKDRGSGKQATGVACVPVFGVLS